MKCTLSGLAALSLAVNAIFAAEPALITPGEPVDYGKLAFSPEIWQAQGISDK